MYTARHLNLTLASIGGLVILSVLSTPVVARTQADSPRPVSPQDVVMRYLDALRTLDQDEMNRYLAEQVTLRHSDGEETSLNKAYSRNIRAFEKGVQTRWSFRVKSTDGDRVTVELTESNEFYDLLGVGTRTQVENYFVRGGRISRMETISLSHQSGDYTETYESFKRWLSKTAAANDSRLTRDGGTTLIFDGQSASALRPWLQRWAAERQKPQR